jgi:hypothetical protein
VQGFGSQRFVVGLYVKLEVHVGGPVNGQVAKFAGHGSQGILPVLE